MALTLRARRNIVAIKKQRREDGEVEGALDVHRRQQDHDGAGDVDGDQQVEENGRQRNHEHHDDKDE